MVGLNTLPIVAAISALAFINPTTALPAPSAEAAITPLNSPRYVGGGFGTQKVLRSFPAPKKSKRNIIDFADEGQSELTKRHADIDKRRTRIKEEVVVSQPLLSINLGLGGGRYRTWSRWNDGGVRKNYRYSDKHNHRLEAPVAYRHKDHWDYIDGRTKLVHHDHDHTRLHEDVHVHVHDKRGHSRSTTKKIKRPHMKHRFEPKQHTKRQLIPLGVPGFVEVASPLFNSTLAKSVAGLVYSANPNAASTNESFLLGTSTNGSSQFYLSSASPLSSATDPNAATSNLVQIRVPILDSQTLKTTDNCATFDLTPPSPLSLQPCGTISGYSQIFSYNSTTGELKPMYATDSPAPMALVQQDQSSSSATDNGASDDSDASQTVSLFFVPSAAFYTASDATALAAMTPADNSTPTDDSNTTASSTATDAASSSASLATVVSAATANQLAAQSSSSPAPAAASASTSASAASASPSATTDDTSASQDGSDANEEDDSFSPVARGGTKVASYSSNNRQDGVSADSASPSSSVAPARF